MPCNCKKIKSNGNYYKIKELAYKFLCESTTSVILYSVDGKDFRFEETTSRVPIKTVHEEFIHKMHGHKKLRDRML